MTTNQATHLNRDVIEIIDNVQKFIPADQVHFISHLNMFKDLLVTAKARGNELNQDHMVDSLLDIISHYMGEYPTLDWHFKIAQVIGNISMEEVCIAIDEYKQEQDILQVYLKGLQVPKWDLIK